MERERKASTQRRDILIAATECAQKSGFHSATMDQIARGAGLSVGQVYRHFENKDAIIGAVAQARARKVLDPFENHALFKTEADAQSEEEETGEHPAIRLEWDEDPLVDPTAESSWSETTASGEFDWDS